MTPIIILWVFLAAIAAWGSAYFAKRDPYSTSWMKIAFAGILLLGFFMALAGLHWRVVGEGFLSHAMLLFYRAMAAVGAPLCIGSIVGTLVGMHRSRYRTLS
jgi:hypothetical protein